MITTRIYKVADHHFAFTMEEKILDQLTNYAPFEVSEGDPLYTLTIVDHPLASYEQMTHVFTDTSDDDMPRIEVYRDAEKRLFRVSMWKESPVCMEMEAALDFSKAELYIHPEQKATRFAIDNAAMLLYAFRTATLHTLEMHASVIMKDGFGQLFLGHSGTGKSTHSRLWQEAYEDAVLMNDDNPVVRLLASGEVRVYGSPWSGKTPCYKQLSAPVRGIVKLDQAPQNEIRRMKLPESYAYMLSSSSGLKIEPEMMDALYDTISQIIQTVPMYHLDCLPDTDAARLCHDTLSK